MNWFTKRKKLAFTLQKRGDGEVMMRVKAHWGHQALSASALFIAASQGLPRVWWAPFIIVFAFVMEGLLDAGGHALPYLWKRGYEDMGLRMRLRRVKMVFIKWFSWWDVYDYCLPVLPAVLGIMGGVIDFLIWFILLPYEAKEDG